ALVLVDVHGGGGESGGRSGKLTDFISRSRPETLDLGQVPALPHSVLVGILGRLDRLGAAIPRRVVAPDHGRGRGERMAAVELERLLRRILDLLARHGLEGAGRERRGELAEMRAALHGAEELPDLLVIARP